VRTGREDSCRSQDERHDDTRHYCKTDTYTDRVLGPSNSQKKMPW
jgi:hypothetical protein